jgi:hypothetical protein
MEQLLRLIRLIAIVMACAWFAYMALSPAWKDGGGEGERTRLQWTVLGAIGGVAVELWVRGWRPSRRIGVWGLLELTALVALAFAIFSLISNA